MIEPEMAFADLDDDMDCIEACLKHCIDVALHECPDEMDFFRAPVQVDLLSTTSSRKERPITLEKRAVPQSIHTRRMSRYHVCSH